MIKIKKPVNLIGFFSENMIQNQVKPTFTGRMKAYTAVIVVMMTVLCYFIFSRSDLNMTVMRGAGMLYQEQPGGYISNIYNAEVINKTKMAKAITIQPVDTAVKVKYIQAPGNVGAGASVKTVFFLLIPASRIHEAKTTVSLQLIQNHKVMQTVKTAFVGPVND
jgi:polyferredoxin